MVTVLHGGRRTTYEPVVATVEVGTVVAAGDVVGRLSVAGGHCFLPAACLHWGLVEGSGASRRYSTRSAWSAADRCGCSRSGVTSR